MLSLEAFDGRSLQTALHLLQEGEAAHLSLPELRAVVAGELHRRRNRLRAEVVAAVPAEIRRAARRMTRHEDRAVCPSCGRGVLAPVDNADGLRIMGCRLCRYSEVMD